MKRDVEFTFIYKTTHHRLWFASRPLKISKLMLNIANIAEKGLSLQLEITYRRKTMAVNRKTAAEPGAGSPVRPKKLSGSTF